MGKGLCGRHGNDSAIVNLLIKLRFVFEDQLNSVSVENVLFGFLAGGVEDCASSAYGKLGFMLVDSGGNVVSPEGVARVRGENGGDTKQHGGVQNGEIRARGGEGNTGAIGETRTPPKICIIVTLGAPEC